MKDLSNSSDSTLNKKNKTKQEKQIMPMEIKSANRMLQHLLAPLKNQYNGSRIKFN